MTISASQVAELRKKTDAGMMDCKRALVETNGDFEAAAEWLRKKGPVSYTHLDVYKRQLKLYGLSIVISKNL